MATRSRPRLAESSGALAEDFGHRTLSLLERLDASGEQAADAIRVHGDRGFVAAGRSQRRAPPTILASALRACSSAWDARRRPGRRRPSVCTAMPFSTRLAESTGALAEDFGQRAHSLLERLDASGAEAGGTPIRLHGDAVFDAAWPKPSGRSALARAKIALSTEKAPSIAWTRAAPRAAETIRLHGDNGFDAALRETSGAPGRRFWPAVLTACSNAWTRAAPRRTEAMRLHAEAVFRRGWRKTTGAARRRFWPTRSEPARAPGTRAAPARWKPSVSNGDAVSTRLTETSGALAREFYREHGRRYLERLDVSGRPGGRKPSESMATRSRRGSPKAAGALAEDFGHRTLSLLETAGRRAENKRRTPSVCMAIVFRRGWPKPAARSAEDFGPAARRACSSSWTRAAPIGPSEAIRPARRQRLRRGWAETSGALSRTISGQTRGLSACSSGLGRERRFQASEGPPISMVIGGSRRRLAEASDAPGRRFSASRTRSLLEGLNASGRTGGRTPSVCMATPSRPGLAQSSGAPRRRFRAGAPQSLLDAPGRERRSGRRRPSVSTGDAVLDGGWPRPAAAAPRRRFWPSRPEPVSSGSNGEAARRRWRPFVFHSDGGLDGGWAEASGAFPLKDFGQRTHGLLERPRCERRAGGGGHPSPRRCGLDAARRGPAARSPKILAISPPQSLLEPARREAAPQAVEAILLLHGDAVSTRAGREQSGAPRRRFWPARARAWSKRLDASGAQAVEAIRLHGDAVSTRLAESSGAPRRRIWPSRAEPARAARLPAAHKRFEAIQFQGRDRLDPLV